MTARLFVAPHYLADANARTDDGVPVTIDDDGVQVWTEVDPHVLEFPAVFE
jgi:hypothetical protein